PGPLGSPLFPYTTLFRSRLSELLANGTNMWRKSRDWQAVVPPMHPRCRHRLVELLPGWTLDEDGRQVYVGPHHHEFNNDIKKGRSEEHTSELQSRENLV